MSGDGRRALRVAEQVRSHLSRVILTELGDPRLNNVVVTRVSLTPDLGYADVRVRLMVGDEDKARQQIMRSLTRASRHLRRGLGPMLGLKRVPELRFHYDTDPDARARVERLLSEIDPPGDD